MAPGALPSARSLGAKATKPHAASCGQRPCFSTTLSSRANADIAEGQQSATAASSRGSSPSSPAEVSLALLAALRRSSR
eukprot:148494-Alexandrium_andersonii.AAC.1